jgi:ankyrin repeat protein
MAPAEIARAAGLVGTITIAAWVSPACDRRCEPSGETMEQAIEAAWDGDAQALRVALESDPSLAEESVCLPEEGLSGRRAIDVSALGGFSSLLLVAARQGHADVIVVLLEHGADPDGSNPLGQTPLHLAAMYGHVAAAEALIAGGAEIEARAQGGYTPLALAAGHGRAPVLKLLLAHGAQVETRDNTEWTPLHRAASEGHDNAVRLLLAHGARVDAADRSGNTPLTYALLKGDDETIRFLVERGARVTGGGEGRSLLALAVENAMPEHVRLLLGHGADPNALDGNGDVPLETAIDYNGTRPERVVENARVLLDNGADVHARWQYGDTPLHRAAARGNLDLALLLLDHGAKVNARNDSGRTPLFHAVTHHEPEIAEALLQHGADPNAEDRQRETPIGQTWGGSVADQEMKALLRRHGAR